MSIVSSEGVVYIVQSMAGWAVDLDVGVLGHCSNLVRERRQKVTHICVCRWIALCISINIEERATKKNLMRASVTKQCLLDHTILFSLQFHTFTFFTQHSETHLCITRDRIGLSISLVR